jgi:hypothetical protein
VLDKFLVFEAELQELLVVYLAPSANLLVELAHVARKLSAEEPILEPISAMNFWGIICDSKAPL